MDRKNITITDFGRLNGMIDKYIADSTEKNLIAIRNLMEEIRYSMKLDAKSIPPDHVTMNTVFELRGIEEKAGIHQYRLVYPEDADVEKGNLSIFDPTGLEAFGQRVGDIVKRKLAAGDTYYQISKIIYQPEAAGDYHL